MVALLSLLILAGVALFLVTQVVRSRKNEEVEIVINEDPECCGAHEVCERDNLQIKDTKIEYFEDEELDALAGIKPERFTDEQTEALAYVLYSLRETDVAPWLRSLQLRGIQLPASLREQALMIVGERRA
jgi:hypothetical protein